jgi:hypothetical protein
MLHSSAPQAFCAPEALANEARCPDCSIVTILGVGVVHLGHYNANGQVKCGLIWTCSDKCFLSFESSQFMGRA